jgi:Rps23 Pro-64 3,4-dihydroxylase Tpa1-like proline 4-hydroxylase
VPFGPIQILTYPLSLCALASVMRLLSFVYYFHKEPKTYTGGELIIHGKDLLNIEPVNNMIIFFDPMLLHEVTVVSSPGKICENGRFTLNGWIKTI